jgi:hypothetical protein
VCRLEARLVALLDEASGVVVVGEACDGAGAVALARCTCPTPWCST